MRDTECRRTHELKSVLRKDLWCIILFLSLFLCFFGCAPKKPPVPIVAYVPSPEHILKKISRGENYNKILKATAKITIRSPEGILSRTLAIVASRPSSFRIEAIPLFGPPDFYLSVNNNVLQAFLPGEEHFYIGRATKENIFSFFQIMLDADDIVSILTGTPLATGNNTVTIKGLYEDNVYRIDFLSENKRIQSLWLDPNLKEMTGLSVLDKDGQLCYKAIFTEYHSVGNTVYPGKIKLIMENPQKISASIKYLDIQVSPEKGNNLFDLPLPPGMAPIFIE